MSEGFNGDYYFFGTWANGDGYTALVDAKGRKPDFSGVSQEINYNNSQFYEIAPGFPGDRFQCHWTGKVAIQEGGVYEFKTGSDDGSRLWINGVPVVENWGLHGTRWITGEARLPKGYHDIKVAMFENGGGASAYAQYKGPDTKNEWVFVHGYH